MARFAIPGSILAYLLRMSDSIYAYLLKLFFGISKVGEAGLLNGEQSVPVRDEIPVLIVGGGPTGLLTAALLSRCGSKLRAGGLSKPLTTSRA